MIEAGHVDRGMLGERPPAAAPAFRGAENLDPDQVVFVESVIRQITQQRSTADDEVEEDKSGRRRRHTDSN
jgi:hypothetical protein